MKEVHVRVSGRVQGVGYRYFVRDAAMSRGVTGWVRNEPDGTVSVSAVGDEAILNDFLSAIRAKGDPVIRVTAMHAEWHEAASHGKGFDIRRHV